jgi:hypothetical protein
MVALLKSFNLAAFSRALKAAAPKMKTTTDPMEQVTLTFQLLAALADDGSG